MEGVAGGRVLGGSHPARMPLHRLHYFRFASNPSMIDAKREDHFLQAAHRTNAAVEADEPGLGPSPGEYRLG